MFFRHTAPQYPRAAGDVAKEVREDIRRLAFVTDPKDGRGDRLSAVDKMGGRRHCHFDLFVVRARAWSPFKARVHLGYTGSM